MVTYFDVPLMRPVRHARGSGDPAAQRGTPTFWIPAFARM